MFFFPTVRITQDGPRGKRLSPVLDQISRSNLTQSQLRLMFNVPHEYWGSFIWEDLRPLLT